jgi:hypothetical protein
MGPRGRGQILEPERLFASARQCMHAFRLLPSPSFWRFHGVRLWGAEACARQHAMASTLRSTARREGRGEIAQAETESGKPSPSLVHPLWL